jgi:hypothetical protein
MFVCVCEVSGWDQLLPANGYKAPLIEKPHMQEVSLSNGGGGGSIPLPFAFTVQSPFDILNTTVNDCLRGQHFLRHFLPCYWSAQGSDLGPPSPISI